MKDSEERPTNVLTFQRWVTKASPLRLGPSPFTNPFSPPHSFITTRPYYNYQIDDYHHSPSLS